MKRLVERETHVCDVCEKDVGNFIDACLRCGKEMCWECRIDHGAVYYHSVSLMGTGDGTYCLPCDTLLSASREDDTHNAFTTIKELREEWEVIYRSFTRRSQIAERHLASLRRGRTKPNTGVNT